jgi:hypothetical protein
VGDNIKTELTRIRTEMSETSPGQTFTYVHYPEAHVHYNWQILKQEFHLSEAEIEASSVCCFHAHIFVENNATCILLQLLCIAAATADCYGDGFWGMQQ